MRRLWVFPYGDTTTSPYSYFCFGALSYLDKNMSAHALVPRERQVHRRGARHHTDVRVLRSRRLFLTQETKRAPQ